MTNAAHTPGPWDYDNYPDHVSYFSDESKRKGDYDFRVEFPDETPEAEAEANARLIAAAPCMLAELKRLPEFLNDEGYARPVLEIEAVLKKATRLERKHPAPRDRSLTGAGFFSCQKG